MVDLHKTDALLQVAGVGHGYEEARMIYYAQVLERHGTTQAEFDSSLVWYTAHPQLFDKIYPKVMKELKAEEDAFLALHEAELNLAEKGEGLQVTGDGIPVTGDGLQEERPFTRTDLDSVLWVTQHGYPHSWNPLVHDLVDELFPQIGVLR